jgi:hypothetical protein
LVVDDGRGKHNGEDRVRDVSSVVKLHNINL